MLIRTLTRACGRLTWQPGQVLDMDAGEARQLVQAGAAVAVDAAPVPAAVEVQPAAVAAPIEPAAPKPRKRKKQ